MYKLIYLKILLILLFVYNPAYSQNVSKAGTTSGNFLEIGAGANALGMHL